MKLHEIYHKDYVAEFKGVDFIGEDEGIMPFDVEVTYDYQRSRGASDEPSSESIVISRIEALGPVTQIGKDDKPIRSWTKGTDVKRLPGWDESHLDWFVDQIAQQGHD